MTTGELLQEARKNMKLTLREVEEAANISNAYLSQLENDKIKRPSANTLYALSKLYRISFDRLMITAGFVEEKDSDRYSPNRLLSMDIDRHEENEIIWFLEYMRFRKSR